MPLPRLMVAPNGATRDKIDHPNLPITLDEIADAARSSFAAGAEGLHLHLRDDAGGHLLDTGAYREALAHLAQVVPDMAVQITTEAAGYYHPAHQRYVALHSNATQISASIREIKRDNELGARRFYQAAAERGIAIQHILYDIEDAETLARVLPEGLFRAPDMQLMFVLGRFTAGQCASPDMLTPFLDWMARTAITPDWAVSAFGQGETVCLRMAAANGGKCRVGFENSFWNADGSWADTNAERVAAIAHLLSQDSAKG